MLFKKVTVLFLSPFSHIIPKKIKQRKLVKKIAQECDCPFSSTLTNTTTYTVIPRCI